MVEKNSISGPSGRFPSTRRSAVVLVGSDDPVERARSFDVIVRAYFKPVYKYVRVRHRRDRDQAEELTQGFFARAFEKRFFARYDAEKARFRTYLKMCLDRYAIESAKTAGRIKRGGEAIRVSLDFDLAEDELTRTGHPEGDPDAYFEREWMRALLGAAVEALRARCQREGKTAQLAVFERYVLDPPDPRPTYADLAAELDIKVTDVTNYLAWARRAFRSSALDQLREITATEDELEAEARLLFGGET
jgi:RNA polymerase sigma factor (sigma-70 family)